MQVPQSETILYEVLIRTVLLTGEERYSVRYDLLFKDKLYYLDEFEEFVTEQGLFLDLFNEVPDMNLTTEEVLRVYSNRHLKGV